MYDHGLGVCAVESYDTDAIIEARIAGSGSMTKTKFRSVWQGYGSHEALPTNVCRKWSYVCEATKHITCCGYAYT